MSTPSKTVNVTVNGKAIAVDSKLTVFQAAQKAGIFIPHYCYHPDLSIAGVCRMCLVEVEKNPKLQISCNTPVAEGMVINTRTDRVKEAVKGVLELHLINHPLDCPICDKAGECKLQDFYRDFGLYKSKVDMDSKVHKPKVVDIGTIVLDAERCILCTRCVRFTAEVTKTHELAIFNRGDRSELKTYDEKPLRNEYTGNLADICPVGALTAKDFRFAQRVWFLDKADTVCTFCSRGCNTVASMNPSTRVLYRVEPRRNLEVNDSWICDRGRWNYEHVYSETRLRVPKKRIDGRFEDVTWEQAFSDLSDEISAAPEKILVAMSTCLTNEEIVDTVETLSQMGVKHWTWVVDEKAVGEREPYDGILQHRDRTPNAEGFAKVMAAMQANWFPYGEAKKRLSSKEFSRVLVIGIEGSDYPGFAEFVSAIPREAKIAYHATNFIKEMESADYVIPNVSAFEKSGTMINVLGRLQKLNAALPWQHMSRDAHAFVFGLRNGNDRAISPTNRHQKVFEATISEKILGTQSTWRQIDAFGQPLSEKAHAEA